MVILLCCFSIVIFCLIKICQYSVYIKCDLKLLSSKRALINSDRGPFYIDQGCFDSPLGLIGAPLGLIGAPSGLIGAPSGLIRFGRISFKLKQGSFNVLSAPISNLDGALSIEINVISASNGHLSGSFECDQCFLSYK